MSERRQAGVHLPDGLFARGRVTSTVFLDGETKQILENGRNRLVIASLVFAIVFTVLGLRLGQLALLPTQGEVGQPVRTASVEMARDRADIVDRNGLLLATSLPTASLFADAAKVIDAEDAARRLEEILPSLAGTDLKARLSSGRRFIWLKRNLTPREQSAVNRAGIPGIGFQRETRRIYPQGRLASHVLGYVDVDNNGMAGVERALDGRLRDTSEGPLRLSVDVRVQHALTDELQRTVTEFKAIGATGIVLDVRTGEVLAMASLPDFDPAEAGSVSPDLKGEDNPRFNRATSGVYEMGSTFKTFTTAMSLDSGRTRLTSGYDATHPLRVARFTISDDHPKARWLTVPEIFMYSSNIGSVRMALDVGTAGQRRFLSNLGFMERSPIELREAGAPLVPNPWREISTMTVAFGHGISITPMHLVTGMAAMINGGILVPPTLVKAQAGVAAQGKRVISAQTSATMRQLLRLVVERGTGRKAEVAGYLIGGKTGTAEKASRHGYRRKALLSSFLAAFPMNDPRYAVLIMVDEPKGNQSTYGYATGGWVSAPAVARVVARVAPILGVEPAPPELQVVDQAMLVAARLVQ